MLILAGWYSFCCRWIARSSAVPAIESHGTSLTLSQFLGSRGGGFGDGRAVTDRGNSLVRVLKHRCRPLCVGHSDASYAFLLRWRVYIVRLAHTESF